MLMMVPNEPSFAQVGLIAKALLKQVEDVTQEHMYEAVPLREDGTPQPSWLAAIRFEIRTKCEHIAHVYGENSYSIRIALDVLFYVFTFTLGHRTFRLTGEEVTP